MATKKSGPAKGPGKGNRTRGPHRVGNRTNHPNKQDSVKWAFKIRIKTKKDLEEYVENGQYSAFVSDAIDEKILRDRKRMTKPKTAPGGP